jgi:membrane protease YdiL (CAAX protease family)
MRAFIKALPPRIEFLIVLLGAFGYFVYENILILLHPSGFGAITNAGLYGLIVIEAFLFSLVWLFLHLRGWTFRKIGLEFRFPDFINGIGLTALAYLAYSLIFWLVLVIGLSPAAEDGITGGSLNLTSIIAVSVLNPLFEEVFVCGYIITAAAKRNEAWAGIHLSVAIRLLYHLYQGPAAAGIIPIGLLFAYWYARTERLWPVIIAHGLMDFFGLIALMGR